MRGKIKANPSKIFRIEVKKQKFFPSEAFKLSVEKHKNKWCEFSQNESGEIIEIAIEETQEVLKLEASALDAIKKKKKDEEDEKGRIEDEKRKKQQYHDMIKKQQNGKDSFVLTKTKLPSDTRETLLDDSDNFNLKLNKLARFEENERDSSKPKFKFFEANRGKVIFEIQPNFGSTNFKELADNQKDSAEAICHKTEVQNFKPDWRMVVGLGGHSVYETSMTLHHIYGFPYIPASSVKGVVRSWIITEVFENDKDKALKNDTSNSKSFCKIFGTQDDQGKAMFFDAFPLSEPKIEVDIMNPHYPKWYDGSQPPTDFQSPNPIPFLTVADTFFQFLVGSRDEEILKLEIGGKDKDGNSKTLFWWLTNALENHGIGAKTAVGYGYFETEKSN